MELVHSSDLQKAAVHPIPVKPTMVFRRVRSRAAEGAKS